MENRQLNFDVSRGGIQHRLFVRVGDTKSRTVSARMYSGAEVVPVTAAYLRAVRADGTRIYAACTVQEGEVVYTFTSEDLACGGELQCEFDLHDGESVMTSPRFIVVCEKLIYDGEGIETSDEYAAYIAALLKLENLTVTAEEGDEAAVTAEVTDTAIGLRFTLPKGDKGDKGETGAQGPQGPQGEKGDTGEAGKTPYIGENGNWYVYDGDAREYVDSGISAGGRDIINEFFQYVEAEIKKAKAAEVIDGVLYVRSPFAYAKITDGVLYANGAFTSAEIENDTLYVQ